MIAIFTVWHINQNDKNCIYVAIMFKYNKLVGTSVQQRYFTGWHLRQRTRPKYEYMENVSNPSTRHCTEDLAWPAGNINRPIHLMFMCAYLFVVIF